MARSIYDRDAEQYDSWYDTPKGQAIFRSELAALSPLFASAPAGRLEVGVGSGRFALALDVGIGVDPAQAALRIAARRGITAVAARGERLPFRPASFDTVLFMVSLCFVTDPLSALREARRVLRPTGRLIVGYLPADGPWGRHYQHLSAAGHAYYQEAHFFPRAELTALLETAGFELAQVRSALFCPPTDAPLTSDAREGDHAAAGFLAILATPRNGG